MGDLRKEFGNRLRFAREMRGLSQAQLGKRADMDPSQIAHFEAGSRLPGAENLAGLAKALLVSADYLLGLSTKIER